MGESACCWLRRALVCWFDLALGAPELRDLQQSLAPATIVALACDSSAHSLFRWRGSLEADQMAVPPKRNVTGSSARARRPDGAEGAAASREHRRETAR